MLLNAWIDRTFVDEFVLKCLLHDRKAIDSGKNQGTSLTWIAWNLRQVHPLEGEKSIVLSAISY